jgi:pyruvate dehydrogenase E2 component (dihydrolipoamide acetyltransferase)
LLPEKFTSLTIFQPIAVLIEEGGDASAFDSFTLEDAGGQKEAPKPAKEEASTSSESAGTSSGSAPPPSSSPVPEEPESSGGKLQSSLDRYLKSEKDTKKAPSGAGAAAPATPAASYVDIPISSMRKTIASRLTESVNQNPHYFVAATVSVTKLMKLRQALNASADGKYKLSVNDFLVKACAVACKKVPTVNSSWRDGFIRQFNNVDVSVSSSPSFSRLPGPIEVSQLSQIVAALNQSFETQITDLTTILPQVAVATPVGLMTPIVKNVDSLGLESISSQVKDLGKRARDGKLKPEEYQGGTFTISNMGMNAAIDRFTAVINPPQAAILAVGTTKKVAIPVEGEDGTGIEWDDQIVVTGSFDHKVVDGAVGAEWIREFKKVVENPLELLL